VIWKFWKKYSESKVKSRKNEEYCDAFYKQGQLRRGMKAFKLYVQAAGNKQFERKMKEKITIEVQTEVEAKKNEIEFLEAMIKELEE